MNFYINPINQIVISFYRNGAYVQYYISLRFISVCSIILGYTGMSLFFYIIDQIAEQSRREEREAIEQKLKEEEKKIQKFYTLINHFCISLYQAQYQSNFYKREDNDKLKNKSRLFSKIPHDLKGSYLDEEAVVEAIVQECIKEDRVYKITNESLKLKVGQGPLLVTKEVFVMCFLDFYRELFKNTAPSPRKSFRSFAIVISALMPLQTIMLPAVGGLGLGTLLNIVARIITLWTSVKVRGVMTALLLVLSRFLLQNQNANCDQYLQEFKRANYDSDIIHLLPSYGPKLDSIYFRTNDEEEPSPSVLHLKTEEINCVTTEEKSGYTDLTIDSLDQVYPIKDLNPESEVSCYSETKCKPLEGKTVEKSSKDIYRYNDKEITSQSKKITKVTKRPKKPRMKIYTELVREWRDKEENVKNSVSRSSKQVREKEVLIVESIKKDFKNFSN